MISKPLWGSSHRFGKKGDRLSRKCFQFLFFSFSLKFKGSSEWIWVTAAFKRVRSNMVQCSFKSVKRNYIGALDRSIDMNEIGEQIVFPFRRTHHSPRPLNPLLVLNNCQWKTVSQRRKLAEKKRNRIVVRRKKMRANNGTNVTLLVVLLYRKITCQILLIFLGPILFFFFELN